MKLKIARVAKSAIFAIFFELLLADFLSFPILPKTENGKIPKILKNRARMQR